MENKRAIQILKLVRSKFMVIMDIDNMSGICYEISKLCKKDIITFNEKEEILVILYDNKPNEEQFTRFTNSSLWVGGVYWWTQVRLHPSTIEIRIKYLTALINKLKE
jgi:hypothetical protein